MIDWRWILKNRIRTSIQWTQLERAVKRALSQIHGDTFIDIGANIGLYSTRLHKNFKRILAVEPNPYTFSVLNQRTRRYRNITTMNIAMSDSDGTAPLFVSPPLTRKLPLVKWFYYSKLGFIGFPGSDSLLEHHPGGQTNLGSISVRTNRFDNIFSTMMTDLVKIDVEGGEFKVIAGMHQSLERKRIRNLLVEIHDNSRRDELESILSSKMDLLWIDPTHIFGRLRSDD